MANKPLHIAINARFLLRDRLEGIGRFSFEVIRRMVQEEPETKFTLYFDRKHDPVFEFGPNQQSIDVFPPARHPFLYYLWFNVSLPRRFQKDSPDLFFSPDGYLSLNTRIPQVGVIHDLAFEHFPDAISKTEAWYYRTYFPRYARLARRLCTVSEFSKQDIVSRYGVPKERIDVVYNGATSAFHPVSEDTKLGVRKRLTNGRPYFYYVGSIHPRKNVDRLIRAWTEFRSRTGADVCLVLVGRKAWKFEEVMAGYRESPYRNDIIFTGFVDDTMLNQISAASIALCYVSLFEGFGIPILEAMHSETAVISSQTASMPEVTGSAGLYIDPHDTLSVSRALETMYMSPTLRDEYIAEGRRQREIFSWELTYRAVRESIRKALP